MALNIKTFDVSPLETDKPKNSELTDEQFSKVLSLYRHFRDEVMKDSRYGKVDIREISKKLLLVKRLEDYLTVLDSFPGDKCAICGKTPTRKDGGILCRSCAENLLYRVNIRVGSGRAKNKKRSMFKCAVCGISTPVSEQTTYSSLQTGLPKASHLCPACRMEAKRLGMAERTFIKRSNTVHPCQSCGKPISGLYMYCQECAAQLADGSDKISATTIRGEGKINRKLNRFVDVKTNHKEAMQMFTRVDYGIKPDIPPEFT